MALGLQCSLVAAEREAKGSSKYVSVIRKSRPTLGLGYRCMNGNEWYLPSKLCSKSSPLILGGWSERAEMR